VIVAKALFDGGDNSSVYDAGLARCLHIRCVHGIEGTCELPACVPAKRLRLESLLTRPKQQRSPTSLRDQRRYQTPRRLRFLPAPGSPRQRPGSPCPQLGSPVPRPANFARCL
jgi:hypothetical protein